MIRFKFSQSIHVKIHTQIHSQIRVPFHVQLYVYIGFDLVCLQFAMMDSVHSLLAKTPMGTNGIASAERFCHALPNLKLTYKTSTCTDETFVGEGQGCTTCISGPARDALISNPTLPPTPLHAIVRPLLSSTSPRLAQATVRSERKGRAQYVHHRYASVGSY